MAELKRPARRPAKSFEEYVAEKTNTPEKRAAYNDAREKVRATGLLLNALDAYRDQKRLTKAEVGRRADMHAAAVSRLFNGDDANPTWETIIELLGALDLHADLTLRPRSHTRDEHVIDVTMEHPAAR